MIAVIRSEYNLETKKRIMLYSPRDKLMLIRKDN